jgi:hypothetical protein
MCYNNSAQSKPLDWVRLITHSLLILVLLGFALYNITTKGQDSEPIWWNLVMLVIGVELDGAYGKAASRLAKGATTPPSSPVNSTHNSRRTSSNPPRPQMMMMEDGEEAYQETSG